MLWGGAYGSLANCVLECCFQIHSKKRNRLEFQRLNDLSYVQYNRKNADRFQKIREEGSKGTRSDPLVLEDLQWDNEWVDHNAQPVYEGSDITWAQVDEAATLEAVGVGAKLLLLMSILDLECTKLEKMRTRRKVPPRTPRRGQHLTMSMRYNLIWPRNGNVGSSWPS